MSERIYLDWNASAPLQPEARAAMCRAMDVTGNPSSVHAEGRGARAIIERAREQVAALVHTDPANVIFTSGATEAASLALSGPGRVAALATEHDAVFAWADDVIAVDTHGQQAGTSPENAAIIAVQSANSETGVRNTPPSCKGAFADLTQQAGKIDTAFSTDYAIVSAHKFGGGRGVGALLLAAGAPLPQMIRGGGQEGRRRAGTENVVAIAGFGAAAEAALIEIEQHDTPSAMRELRDRWEAALFDTAPEAIVLGGQVPRLPNTSCFAIPGWAAEKQVMQLDLRGIAISAGSACSSGKVGPSRVIAAMGYSDDVARCAVRVSIGPTTTNHEIDRFIAVWTDLYRRQRARAA